MPPKRITSTKTLFDDLFSSIPADVFIDFGATSVMEEMALEASATEDPAHPLTKAASAVSMYATLDDDETDDFTSGTARTPLTSSLASTTTTSGSLFAAFQPKGLARTTLVAAGKRTRDAANTSRATFALELDESDEAVREATKYAAYVEAAQARDIKAAQAHLAQRSAQLHETLYTGGEADHEHHSTARNAGLRGHGEGRSSLSSYSSYSTARPGYDGPGDASRGRTMGTGGLHASDRGSASGGPARAAGGIPDDSVDDAEQTTGARPRTGDTADGDGDGAAPETLAEALAGGRGGAAARAVVTAEEQVARMPPGRRTLYAGRCAMFRHGKDFGFIVPDVGGPDVYFTRESVFYTFTRLALRHFYEQHKVPVPPSVAEPLQMMEDAARELAQTSPKVEDALHTDSEAVVAVQAQEAETDAVSPSDLVPTVSSAGNGNEEGDRAMSADAGVALADAHDGNVEGDEEDGENGELVDAPLLVEPEEEDGDEGLDEHLLPPLATLTEMAAGVTPPHEEATNTTTTTTTTAANDDDSAVHASVGILPTPAVRVQQPTVSEAALAASRAAALVAAGLCPQRAVGGGDTRERLLAPPLTTAESEKAKEAAALLTSQTAQLLQWQLDLGTGAVAVHERVSFTSHWNKAAAHGKGARLLRGEHVRGAANRFYALQIEQAWFCAVFPDATGRKRDVEAPPSTTGPAAGTTSTTAMTTTTAGSSMLAGLNSTVKVSDSVAASSKGDRPALLERYVGTVRGFVAEEQRGYLRPDDPNAQDVIFNTDAILWDPRFPPASRTIVDRMRVCYSVCGRERQRYTATLITAVDDTPLTPANVVMADDGTRRAGRRGGGGDDNANNKRTGGGGGGEGEGGAGGTGGREGGGREGRRKRPRDDEETLLLFDESDYASMI